MSYEKLSANKHLTEDMPKLLTKPTVNEVQNFMIERVYTDTKVGHNFTHDPILQDIVTAKREFYESHLTTDKSKYTIMFESPDTLGSESNPDYNLRVDYLASLVTCTEKESTLYIGHGGTS